MDNKFFSTSDGDSDGKDKDKNNWSRRISWSQFKTYQKCPKKWELKYKEGHYIPARSIHLIFGTALHEAIQTYLKKMYEESVSEAENLNLREILVKEMRKAFKEEKQDIKESEYIDSNEFPASHAEMKKFLMEGEEILKTFKSNRTDYFNKKETNLVGIEKEIDYPLEKNIDYIGYLDVVLKKRGEEEYIIYDLKTSTSGWDKYKKKEKLRVNQLVSYKMYYADVLDTDPKNIEIDYLIFKREVDGGNYFNNSRIQVFAPASGPRTQNKIREQIENFVNETYNKDGSRKEKEYQPKPGKFKCCFCEFSSQFDSEYPVCNQEGKRFDNYPEGMRGYVNDKWINNE